MPFSFVTLAQAFVWLHSEIVQGAGKTESLPWNKIISFQPGQFCEQDLREAREMPGLMQEKGWRCVA